LLYDVAPGASGSLEALAFEAAVTRMIYVMLPYPLLALMETGCGAVRGLGKSLSSTVISLLGACVFRVVWVFTVFHATPTLEVLYVSYPISWLLTALAQFLCAALALRHYIKTRRSLQEIERMQAPHLD